MRESQTNILLSLRRNFKSIGEMIVSGFDFEYICDIEPTRDVVGKVIQCLPQHRYRNVAGLSLNQYGSGPFCKFKIPNQFQISGVYVICVNNEMRYVGECTNLSKRFNAGYGNISPKNCFKGGQETNCRVNNLIYFATAEDSKISVLFFPTRDYKLMEAALRAALKFVWNRV